MFVTMNSLAAKGGFGSSVGGIGDLNGDGVPNFIISGGISDTTPGHVHLVRACCRPLSHTGAGARDPLNRTRRKAKVGS